jgi:hypothetical protein
MSNDNVQFKEWLCAVELGQYGNKRLAIQLVSAVEDHSKDLYLGEPIGTATVNMPDIDITKDQVIIKAYSENEGMVEALQKAGYISENVQAVNIGFVDVHIAEKTDKLKQLEAAKFPVKKPKM